MLESHNELRTWLSGVDYPASKTVILEYAQNHGAPEHVMQALQSIPATTYQNRVS